MAFNTKDDGGDDVMGRAGQETLGRSVGADLRGEFSDVVPLAVMQQLQSCRRNGLGASQAVGDDFFRTAHRHAPVSLGLAGRYRSAFAMSVKSRGHGVSKKAGQPGRAGSGLLDLMPI